MQNYGYRQGAMENAPEKENTTFPRLYAGAPAANGGRRIVFAPWPALEPAEGHINADAAAAVREALMRCIARGESPVLCLYAGEDPAWFTAKGGWLAEDNLRCFLRYAGRAARAFGHLTDEYITFFEPNELVWEKSANRNLRLRFKMLSHMACAHVRAVKLVRDTRAQRQLPETRLGFVLRMYPAIELRRGLLRGDNAATASAYEILPLLAMARGEFLPPLRNTLRIRPGSWADFIAVSGGGDEEKRRYCCRAAATLAETEIWEVADGREDG